MFFLFFLFDPSWSESIRVDPTRTGGPSWSGPTFVPACLKVELPFLTFFFHLFPIPPVFLLILFLSFCLAFVHRVHFYGKGLGKTVRIIELAGLKIFKFKIFIETFGSTLLSVFLWPVWLNHARSGCFSLHKFDVKVLYDCLNWWQFLVCKVLKYLSKVVLHTCRAQNNFPIVTGHNHWQKKFLLGHLIFWTGQKLGKKVN